MRANELVQKVINIANNYKTLYVYACFGAPLNNANKQRYTNNCDYNRQASRRNKILNASSDTFGFDCVNLIKGILWGWNGDLNHAYGGAVYGSNGCPDTNANGMFWDYCYDQSSNFGNIIPGEFVWMEGHIGVYIGDGLAVECTPIWKDGVQITAVGNIGSKAGYSTRTWTSHGKSKLIDYSKPQPKIKYCAHVQSDGWQEWKGDGELAGTTGQSKRLEAFKIDYKEHIKAKIHLEGIGWKDYGEINKDTIIGTTGESRRLECICLECESIKYRAHIQGSGWTCWTKADGKSTLGSVGQSLRIEAIEIVEI